MTAKRPPAGEDPVEDYPATAIFDHIGAAGAAARKLGLRMTFVITLPVLGLVFFGVAGLLVGAILGAMLLAVVDDGDRDVPQATAIDDIERLADLRDRGALTDEEYTTMKTDLIERGS